MILGELRSEILEVRYWVRGSVTEIKETRKMLPWYYLAVYLLYGCPNTY